MPQREVTFAKGGMNKERVWVNESEWEENRPDCGPEAQIVFSET